MLQAVIVGTLRKFAPWNLPRRPVFALLTTGSVLAAGITLVGLAPASFGWIAAASMLLVALVGILAEAFAAARLHGQVASLRRARQDLMALRLGGARDPATGLRSGEQHVAAAELHPGALVVVSAGDLIPTDGVIEHGMATVNEAAITGESAPVLREAGTDYSNVIGGTRVLTGEIVVRVTAEPGHDFVDRMITRMEADHRDKPPQEARLGILVTTIMLTALMACAALGVTCTLLGVPFNPLLLIALFLCLMPTTITSLLPVITIAGLSRALAVNVLAKSVDAVTLAGAVDVLLLDKTGAITHGNRAASKFHELAGIDIERLCEAALLGSLADPTPEGKSIVSLARDQGAAMADPEHAKYVEFSAETRMTGVDLDDGARVIRIGALNVIAQHLQARHGDIPVELRSRVEQVARTGATPLVVSEGRYVLGVIELSSVVRHGIKERFARLRAMGVRSIMLTADDPLAAAAIAAEAGVDDFVIVGKATLEDRLKRIRAEHAAGHRVATIGSVIADVPVLAESDVGLAMNSASLAAKEAGNMIDLDSDPTKLLILPELGRTQRITGDALTRCSLAVDLAKFFAVLPALLAVMIPSLAALNVLGLSSAHNVVIATLILNALVVPVLVPLALRGLRLTPTATTELLRRNRLWFGIGGMLLPFFAIKLIDLVLATIAVV